MKFLTGDDKMKKIRNLVIGGLQQKIFNLVLITIVLIAGALILVFYREGQRFNRLAQETNNKQIQSIEEISSSTMDAVVTGTLSTSTSLQAGMADEIFCDLRTNVKTLADIAGSLLEHPEQFIKKDVQPPDVGKEGTSCLQLLTDGEADLKNRETADKIRLLANLEDAMTALVENSQLYACYIGLPEGVFLIADQHPASKYSEEGEIETFPVTGRPWYTGAARAQGVWFTYVPMDPFADKPELICSVPVYADGELAAVVGADLFLDSLSEMVDTMLDENVGYACILDADGQVVFSPLKEGTFALSSGEKQIGEDDEELSSFLYDAYNGPTGVRLLTIDGNPVYVAGAPIPSVGWTMISVVDEEVTKQSTNELISQYESIGRDAGERLQNGMSAAVRKIGLLLGIILVLGSTSALILAKRIVRPLNSMVKRMAGLSGDRLVFEMAPEDHTGDEIEVLAESFASLSAKTVRYIDENTRITAEKERIGTELTMAKSIQASQLPTIFPAYPDRSEFDLYASMTPAKEVGGDFYDFFLLDEDHLCMVIADVSGKGVPAALFMMISKILIKNSMQSGNGPGKTLEIVNNQLMENNREEMFVTVWLGILEISTGHVTDANAGHEHPVIKRGGGMYEMVKYRHSPAVAVLENMKYRDHVFSLEPGDQIFLYTDGVIEAVSADDRMFGAERLLASLNRDRDAEPMEALQNVMEDISLFSEGAEQFDDITMLCLHYNGPAGMSQGK